jgi:hypothetical protein
MIPTTAADVIENDYLFTQLSGAAEARKFICFHQIHEIVH